MSTPKHELLERIDDYVSGTLDDTGAEALEEQLFAAAFATDEDGGAAAAELFFADKLRRGLADLAARGSYEVTMTVAEAEELARTSPLKTRIFDAVEAQGLDAAIALADLDLAFFSFPADLTGVERVDLELGWGDQVLITLPDVRTDREKNRVVLCCEAELARASFQGKTFSRLVAVEGANRRVLGHFPYLGPSPQT